VVSVAPVSTGSARHAIDRARTQKWLGARARGLAAGHDLLVLLLGAERHAGGVDRQLPPATPSTPMASAAITARLPISRSSPAIGTASQPSAHHHTGDADHPNCAIGSCMT
jgi:hypothetical protein